MWSAPALEMEPGLTRGAGSDQGSGVGGARGANTCPSLWCSAHLLVRTSPCLLVTRYILPSPPPPPSYSLLSCFFCVSFLWSDSEVIRVPDLVSGM